MQMDDNALGNDMSTMQPSLWKTPASSHLCRSHLTKADAPNARQYGTAVSVQVGSRNIGESQTLDISGTRNYTLLQRCARRP